jgi:hypothetical protein
MLVSMKHTNEALQKLGLKVSDADNIMLDLEDSHTNINNLQASLSSAFVVDDNVTDMDLSEELELLLSDEYLEPSSVQRKNSEKIATNNSEKIATNNSEKIAEKNSQPTPEPAEPVQEQVLEVITEHDDEQTQETVATTANHL